MEPYVIEKDPTDPQLQRTRELGWIARMMAEEFDAVHLTVSGWLATGGLAIPVGAGTASVVAGWTPGTTAWLRDPAPAVDQATSQHWFWDDRGWRRV